MSRIWVWRQGLCRVPWNRHAGRVVLAIDTGRGDPVPADGRGHIAPYSQAPQRISTQEASLLLPLPLRTSSRVLYKKGLHPHGGLTLSWGGCLQTQLQSIATMISALAILCAIGVASAAPAFIDTQLVSCFCLVSLLFLSLVSWFCFSERDVVQVER